MALWWPKDNFTDMDGLQTALATYGAQDLEPLWKKATPLKGRLVESFTDRSGLQPEPPKGAAAAAVRYADYTQQYLGSAAAVQNAAPVIGKYSALLSETIRTIERQRDRWEAANQALDHAVAHGNQYGPGATQGLILEAQRRVTAVETENSLTRQSFVDRLPVIAAELQVYVDGLTGPLMARPELAQDSVTNDQMYLSPPDLRGVSDEYLQLAYMTNTVFTERRKSVFDSVKAPREDHIGPAYAALMTALAARGRQAVTEYERLANVTYQVADTYDLADHDIGRAFVGAAGDFPAKR